MTANYEEPMEQREQHDACINVAESRQRKSKNLLLKEYGDMKKGKNFFEKEKIFLKKEK